MLFVSQTDSGTLQINVFDKTVADPIEGAKINISVSDENGINTSLYDLFTDNEGKSDVISLSAPPFLYSQSPDQPKPYSTYNISINAEGYEAVDFIGTQVFADNLSIQNAYLTPLQNNDEQIIDIPAPRLWGDYPPKIPEEEIKPLPPESGFVVLDNVIIPEYIVVHDGSPNDPTAPNYYIPFKDYIKNVASSEIYTTWPEEAIKANVLAIISFTLNRVYTEWYRSKGKNFTITSSTAYDHFFVYGRNIYKEINDIVDDLFTSYIKRNGSNQPLLAQYCDGIQVVCPDRMTQWGSKYLADQGFSAIDILRYYYGNDIYIENADIVSGVPVSYPGYTLSIGSTGA
ncbi:MAG: peptidoglycan-binding protein [Firmicutes bacterium]|nr:peptidoglycan-binding protein [Bacillota bacterium]